MNSIWFLPNSLLLYIYICLQPSTKKSVDERYIQQFHTSSTMNTHIQYVANNRNACAYGGCLFCVCIVLCVGIALL